MRRTAAGTVLVAVVISAAATLPAPAFAASPAAVPKPAATLPASLEDLTGYVPQTSCDPVARTGTVALARLLTATYPDTTTATSYGCGSDGPVSEHYDGRAIDWMFPSRTATQLAEADAFLSWLLASDSAGHPYAMARRLGVMYVIYNSRIWGAYRAGDGWRPYSCSGVTGCHQDHVHISLSWNGATGRTSFFTGQVAAGVDYGPCRPADLNWAAPYAAMRSSPCPAYTPVTAPAGSSSVVARLFTFSGAQVQQGSTGPVVSAVQAYLGATVDGDFGPQTKASVVSFQTANGLSPSGVVDAPTWRRLLAVGAAPPATAPPMSLVQPDKTAGQPVTLSGTAAPGATVRVYYRNAATNGSYLPYPAAVTADGAGSWRLVFTPFYSGTYYATTSAGSASQSTPPLSVDVNVKVTIDAVRYLGRDSRGRCVTRFLGGTYPYISAAPVWIRDSSAGRSVPIGSGTVSQFGNSGRYDIRFGLTCGQAYTLFSLISGTGGNGVSYAGNGVGADTRYVAGG